MFSTSHRLSCQLGHYPGAKNNAQALFGAVPTRQRIQEPAGSHFTRRRYDSYWKMLGILEDCAALKRFRFSGFHARRPLTGQTSQFSENLQLQLPRGDTGRFTAIGRSAHAHIINVSEPHAPNSSLPQDGALKQDCEINASKRWMSSATEWLRPGQTSSARHDDLYAHVPFAEGSPAPLSIHFMPAAGSPTGRIRWLDLLEPCDVIAVRRESDGRKRMDDRFWCAPDRRGRRLT